MNCLERNGNTCKLRCDRFYLRLDIGLVEARLALEVTGPQWKCPTEGLSKIEIFKVSRERRKQAGPAGGLVSIVH